VKGRKRHILVDTMGLLLAVVVHAANISEQAGARQIMRKVAASKAAGASLFQRLRLLWVEAGYQAGKDFCAWVKALVGWRVEVIKRPKKNKAGEKSAASCCCRAAGWWSAPSPGWTITDA
jgi:putative transposase